MSCSFNVRTRRPEIHTFFLWFIFRTEFCRRWKLSTNQNYRLFYGSSSKVAQANNYSQVVLQGEKETKNLNSLKDPSFSVPQTYSLIKPWFEDTGFTVWDYLRAQIWSLQRLLSKSIKLVGEKSNATWLGSAAYLNRKESCCAIGDIDCRPQYLIAMKGQYFERSVNYETF